VHLLQKIFIVVCYFCSCCSSFWEFKDLLISTAYDGKIEATKSHLTSLLRLLTKTNNDEHFPKKVHNTGALWPNVIMYKMWLATQEVVSLTPSHSTVS